MRKSTPAVIGFLTSLCICVGMCASVLSAEEADQAAPPVVEGGTGPVVPTLGEWGLVLLSLALVAVAGRFVLTRRTTH